MPIKNSELLKEARMRAEEKRKDTRFRLWEFVAFGDLDKVMPNWKSAMRDVFIAFEVYAFPTYVCEKCTQVLIKSKSLKTREQIVSLLKSIVPTGKEVSSLVNIPDVIPSYPQDTSQRLRCFIHADLEGKRLPQYSPDDFYLVGTADPLKKIKWTDAEKDLHAQEMLEYARGNKISTMCALWEAFADSRIHTYMMTQGRVRQQLTRYFSSIEETKRSDRLSCIEQLQKQLLEQAKRTVQLQEELLTVQKELEGEEKEICLIPTLTTDK